MIEFRGEKYDAIDQFDCHVLSFKYEPEGGGFCTILPISPLSYRKNVPSNSSHVRVSIEEKHTEFLIVDDHNKAHLVKVDNKHSDEIVKAIAAATREQLLLTE